MNPKPQRNANERKIISTGRSYADYLAEAKSREPRLYAPFKAETATAKEKRERITDRDLQRLRKLDKL